MSFEKSIERESMYSKIFILIGIIAGIIGVAFDYQRGLMLGITMGFLPTGIGTLLIYKYGSKNAVMKKNMQLEHEERNIFINTKAGYTAFWISYWYIFLAVVLKHSLKFNLEQFLIGTLIFMPVVYFLFVIIYHKKY